MLCILKLCLLAFFLFLDNQFQHGCQLVGAGSWFWTAGDAFYAFDNPFRSLAFHQSGEGFQVARAAWEEFCVADYTVFDVQFDLFAAGALCVLYIMHGNSSLFTNLCFHFSKSDKEVQGIFHTFF